MKTTLVVNSSFQKKIDDIIKVLDEHFPNTKAWGDNWFIMDDDGSGTCQICFVLDEENDDE